MKQNKSLTVIEFCLLWIQINSKQLFLVIFYGYSVLLYIEVLVNMSHVVY